MRKLNCCVASFFLLLATLAETETVNGIEWTYAISSGMATVGGYPAAIPQSTIGEIQIPSSLGGCPVVCVDAHAFYGCAKLTSVTIPDGVTTIGEWAFGFCNKLSSVMIPPSVTNIGNDAFAGTPFLANQHDGLMIFGSVVVGYKGMCPAHVDIPSGVRTIGVSAFENCGNLTSVAIPLSVLKIENNAFSGCVGIRCLTIPQCVCDGELYSVFPDAYEAVQEISIVEGVTNIGYKAFGGCAGLKNVSMPSSVIEIDNYAFIDCSGLSTVTIPSGVSRIGVGVFSGCENLTTIQVDLSNKYYASVEGVLYNKDITAVVKCPYGRDGVVTIPESVTQIGNSAFAECGKLTSVNIPSSVTTIGEWAFSGCIGLKTMNIPLGVRTIAYGAFFECSGLQKITIPETVRSIAGGLCSGCSGLKEVAIPPDLTCIGSGAFSDCKSLKTVEIPLSVTNVGSGAFSGCVGLERVTIPQCICNRRYSDPFFDVRETLREIVIADGVISIAEDAFHDYSGLERVSIPSSVTSVGRDAFYGCDKIRVVSVPQCVCDKPMSTTFPSAYKSIQEIAIADGVTHVCLNAFTACKNLVSITIASSVTNIGDSAFFECSRLENLVLQEGVENIEQYAFYGCASLTSLTIPRSVTTIGESAFECCSGLSSVAMVGGVRSVGKYAFYECVGLLSVIIPQSVASIGYDAFRYCNKLTTVRVTAGDGNRVGAMLSNSGFDVSKIKIEEARPDGVYTEMVAGRAWTYRVKGVEVSVGGGDSSTRAIAETTSGTVNIPSTIDGWPVTGVESEAFEGCDRLIDVTIPSGVTSIGDRAFIGCLSLESIVIPDSVVELGEDAFYKCEGLKSIVLPSGLTAIKSGTFMGCGLTSISIPDSVSNISPLAFGCQKLRSIEVGGNNKYYSSLDGVLYDKGKGTLVYCPSQAEVPLSLPSTVIKIGSYALQDFHKLTLFEIPDGVQTVESRAFYCLHELESLTIPPSVTSIGKEAFLGCTSLKTFYVRSGDAERVKGLVESSGFGLKGTEWVEMCSVSFELGAHGKRIGGGELNQVVASGGAAISPTVEPDYGWTFDGWDKSFDKVMSDLVVSARWTRVKWTVNEQNPDGSMTPHAVEHEGKMNFTAPKSTIDMDDKRQIVYLGSSVTAPEVLSQFELSVTNDMLVVWDVRATNFWLATSSPVEDAYYVTVNEWVAANDTRWVYVHPAAHWHLVRWTGDVEGCVSDGNRLKVVMDRPRTIGAELAQDEFTVTFDLGGKGRRTGGGSLRQSIVYGGCATAPDVEPDYGWVFEGWDRDLTQRITGDVTIQAVWRCIKFSETIGGVTYDYLLKDGVAVLDNNGAAAVAGVAAGGVVVVPESLGGSPLESIGEGAFRGNKSMASVSLPVAVTSIGADAFAGCDNLTAVRVADVASWLDVSFANAAANPLNNGAALYVRPTTANWFDAGIGDYVDWPSGGADKVIEGVGTWRETANAVLECEAGVSWLSSVGRNAVRFEADSPRKTLDGMVVVEAVMTASAVGTLPEVASDVKCGFAMVEEANGLKCAGAAKSSSGAFNDWVLLDGCLVEEGQQIALSVSTKKVSGQTYVKYAVNGVELTHGGETWLPMVVESDSIREVSFVGELFSLSGEVVSGGDESAVVDLIIPEGVERVGDYAFAGCASIVNVVIPESVTSVAPTAFIGCANLKTITLKRKGMDLSWIPDGCEVVYDIDYLVTFDLGAHGERSGGGALQQLVHHGSAAVAPEVLAESGWEFVGWDCAFDAVTDALTVKAVWAELIQDPVILPGDGSVFYDESCMVTITCATAGAKIYYSTRGTPRKTDAYLYTKPFVIDGTASVKAIAVRDGKESGWVTVTITKSIMGLAEAVDAPGVNFETGGATGWRGLPDADAKVGGFVAKSGTTEPNQTNWMEARVEGAGVLTFWWKVNCEEDDSGDCTWDRLMYFVDDAEKDAERIDGVTSWAQCRVEFKTAGWHKVRWEFYRDGEDDPDLVYANCGWVDGVVWTPSDPIPPLGPSADAATVREALEGSTDWRLQANIADPTTYTAYREWALKIGATDVKASPFAWASFATDSAALLAKMPTDDDLKVEEFKPSAMAGAFDFTVSVMDVTIGDKASVDNLKKLFGLEGAESLDAAAFSSENVSLDFREPQDGKLKFSATPAVDNAKSFFMKVKVK